MLEKDGGGGGRGVRTISNSQEMTRQMPTGAAQMPLICAVVKPNHEASPALNASVAFTRAALESSDPPLDSGTPVYALRMLSYARDCTLASELRTITQANFCVTCLGLGC